MVWGEGGSGGGGGIETGVSIPAKLGGGWGGMERCRRDMERQVAMENRERIVIGGDFNASIGRGGERRGYVGSMIWVGEMRQVGIWWTGARRWGWRM